MFYYCNLERKELLEEFTMSEEEKNESLLFKRLIKLNGDFIKSEFGNQIEISDYGFKRKERVTFEKFDFDSGNSENITLSEDDFESIKRKSIIPSPTFSSFSENTGISDSLKTNSVLYYYHPIHFLIFPTLQPKSLFSQFSFLSSPFLSADNNSSSFSFIYLLNLLSSLHNLFPILYRSSPEQFILRLPFLIFISSSLLHVSQDLIADTNSGGDPLKMKPPLSFHELFLTETLERNDSFTKNHNFDESKSLLIDLLNEMTTRKSSNSFLPTSNELKYSSVDFSSPFFSTLSTFRGMAWGIVKESFILIFLFLVVNIKGCSFLCCCGECIVKIISENYGNEIGSSSDNFTDENQIYTPPILFFLSLYEPSKFTLSNKMKRKDALYGICEDDFKYSSLLPSELASYSKNRFLNNSLDKNFSSYSKFLHFNSFFFFIKL
jgi:hypothetical protein